MKWLIGAFENRAIVRIPLPKVLTAGNGVSLAETMPKWLFHMRTQRGNDSHEVIRPKGNNRNFAIQGNFLDLTNFKLIEINNKLPGH